MKQKPAEEAQHPAKENADQDFDNDGAPAEGEGKETENKGEEHHAAAGSAQSDAVNKMLADAAKQVKAKGMTNHPETEAANKKIIDEEEQAKKEKKGGLEAEHKEKMGDKIKGMMHHHEK